MRNLCILLVEQSWFSHQIIVLTLGTKNIIISWDIWLPSDWCYLSWRIQVSTRTHISIHVTLSDWFLLTTHIINCLVYWMTGAPGQVRQHIIIRGCMKPYVLLLSNLWSICRQESHPQTKLTGSEWSVVVGWDVETSLGRAGMGWDNVTRFQPVIFHVRKQTRFHNLFLGCIDESCIHFMGAKLASGVYIKEFNFRNYNNLRNLNVSKIPIPWI